MYIVSHKYIIYIVKHNAFFIWEFMIILGYIQLMVYICFRSKYKFEKVLLYSVKGA